MAFMGRGSAPSGRGNKTGGSSRGHHRGHWYHRRFYYYVSPSYILIEMIVFCIIFIIGLITFFATYKFQIIDPIESTKNDFINAYLLVIGLLSIIALIINFFSKSKGMIITGLIIIFVISLLAMFLFFGIKMNMDATYTKEKFQQIYTELNGNNKTDNLKIDVSTTKITLKTEEEFYINQCLKLYNIFNAKFYVILGIHLLLNLLLIYQILKISKIQEKKDKLRKDDLILYDEEQNVKI